MTLRQPLFQQNDTTDQAADVTRLFFRDILNGRTGFVQEDAMKVIQRGAGANNSVDILAGSAFIPGSETATQGSYFVVNDATVNLVMSSAAHATLPRIDTVAVKVRDAFYSGVDNDAQFIYVAGTAAASPVAPDLDALGHENHIQLAHITIPANDNTITTADISDQRMVFGARAGALSAAWVSSNAPPLPRFGQFWFDTQTTILKINVGTSAVPIWSPVSAGLSWTTFTPSWGNFVLGSGGTNVGSYMRLGRLVIAKATFVLGSSGNVTGLLSWVPPAAVPLKNTGDNYASAFAWANVGTGNLRYGGIGITVPTEGTIARFASNADNVGWQATIPADWQAGNQMNMLAIYESSVSA
jgi:hypothetical protein